MVTPYEKCRLGLTILEKNGSRLSKISEWHFRCVFSNLVVFHSKEKLHVTPHEKCRLGLRFLEKNGSRLSEISEWLF